MTSWQEFREQSPSLASRVHARFTAEKSHVLATLRRDGSPRVSGSEVDFHGEEAYIGSMLDARKAQDLQRDNRFAIHAYPGIEEGGDAKLAGVVAELTDKAEIAALQGNDEPCHLFRLGLREVVLTWVADDTLFAESWREGKGTVKFARPGNGPAEVVE
ncbi:pyridoxamine 5'-phosphate oxidase family protein [Amycolatopsis sp., V23-08]|uniref:Pyridoxamine 5'-phosphate oxidase family protein n=1 Tax=Amycolatopsis heterodermiae TaxID=3110235 RepID=A0ABU5RPD2_9PSEU|nr:pyridoxamine 5'-phosphate oxidase family protein [Amycolatopsis sp., V23-08]MEA5367554.1 pyridoxamine 5'-phosphate oxidase family protein [Amycolatopsis sp., V23-08]